MGASAPLPFVLYIYQLLNTISLNSNVCRTCDITISDEDYNGNQTKYYPMAHLSIGTINWLLPTQHGGLEKCTTDDTEKCRATFFTVCGRTVNVWTRP